MDRIRLAAYRRDECGTMHVKILVNGRGLADIVTEAEVPKAKREGWPEMAGGWGGIPLEIALLPSRHLLGEPQYAYAVFGKPALLVCECGYPSCDSFGAIITLDDDTVKWSDYVKLCRSQPPREWKFDELGEFVFDRRQYEAELAKKPGESD